MRVECWPCNMLVIQQNRQMVFNPRTVQLTQHGLEKRPSAQSHHQVRCHLQVPWSIFSREYTLRWDYSIVTPDIFLLGEGIKLFSLYVLQVLLGEVLAFINEQRKGTSSKQFSSRVVTVLSYDNYQAKGVSCFERNGPYMSDQLGPLGYLLYFLRVKTKLCDMQIIVSHEFRISFLSKSGLHVSCLHKLVFLLSQIQLWSKFW